MKPRFFLYAIFVICCLIICGCGDDMDLGSAPQTQQNPAPANPAQKGTYSKEAKEAAQLMVQATGGINKKEKMLGMTPLHMAVTMSENDRKMRQRAPGLAVKEIVAALLDMGADVNVKSDAGGMTPLHLAIVQTVNANDFSNKDVIELLIAKGADVNAKNDLEGFTPLHFAALTKYKELIEMLIAKGADVNAVDKKNHTPLHMVAYSGSKGIAELLIGKTANINVKNDTGHTPLHFAAQYGVVGIADLLASKGADINAVNDKGYTPLHFAIIGSKKKGVLEFTAGIGELQFDKSIRYKYPEVVELLITRGANLAIQDEDGLTPLDFAIKEKQNRLVEILKKNNAPETTGDKKSDELKRKADGLIKLCGGINGRDKGDKDGMTPLHYASSDGNAKLAEYLIKQGADVNVKNALGETPLHKATKLAVATLLLEKGADTEIKNNAGNTPLDAMKQVQIDQQKEIAALLTEHKNKLVAKKFSEKTVGETEILIAQCGGEINKKDKDGNTPLHLAITTGRKEVVECLIECGANVNGKGGQFAATPLHYAAQEGNKEIAALLIAKGASINAKDETSCTPLHYAVQYDKKAIVELLIAKNADIDAKDDTGWTPLDSAISKDKQEIADILRKAGAHTKKVKDDNKAPDKKDDE